MCDYMNIIVHGEPTEDPRPETPQEALEWAKRMAEKSLREPFADGEMVGAECLRAADEAMLEVVAAGNALAAELERLRGEVEEAKERAAWLEAHEEDWRAQHLEDTKRIEALRGALNIDKTGLASALAEIRIVVNSYQWIGAGEWGSYAYHERNTNTLRSETSDALSKIAGIAAAALNRSGDLATEAIRNTRQS